MHLQNMLIQKGKRRCHSCKLRNQEPLLDQRVLLSREVGIDSSESRGWEGRVRLKKSIEVVDAFHCRGQER